MYATCIALSFLIIALLFSFFMKYTQVELLLEKTNLTIVNTTNNVLAFFT